MQETVRYLPNGFLKQVAMKAIFILIFYILYHIILRHSWPGLTTYDIQKHFREELKELKLNKMYLPVLS